MRDVVRRALDRLRDERGATRPDHDADLVCLDALGGAKVLCPVSALRVIDATSPDWQVGGPSGHGETDDVVDADVGIATDEWIVAHPADVHEIREVR